MKEENSLPSSGLPSTCLWLTPARSCRPKWDLGQSCCDLKHSRGAGSGSARNKPTLHTGDTAMNNRLSLRHSSPRGDRYINQVQADKVSVTKRRGSPRRVG